MRVVILTQQDKFFIPKNIEKIMSVCEVVEIVNIECKSSLDHKMRGFMSSFGLYQTARMGFQYIGRSLEGLADSLTHYKAFGGYCSIKHIAKKHHVAFETIHQVNDDTFYEHMKALKPDLMISYSAPQVIKERLLKLPPKGIINVHGSLLPDYRGCLPSFWYLYNKESWGGATVHYMGEKLDDGDIIAQGKVDLSQCQSMFEVMQKTKKLGGELMVQAITQIEQGTVKPRPNIASEGRYFTWPKPEQIKELVKGGYRLI